MRSARPSTIGGSAGLGAAKGAPSLSPKAWCRDFTGFRPETATGRRDEGMRQLKASGIETRAYFSPPVHEQAFFARFSDRQLPRTEALARRVITLPFYTSITTAEMDYVVDALVEAERSLA